MGGTEHMDNTEHVDDSISKSTFKPPPRAAASRRSKLGVGLSFARPTAGRLTLKAHSKTRAYLRLQEPFGMKEAQNCYHVDANVATPSPLYSRGCLKSDLRGCWNLELTS